MYHRRGTTEGSSMAARQTRLRTSAVADGIPEWSVISGSRTGQREDGIARGAWEDI